MANSLLTINQITRKALALFRNSNAFLQSIDRQYDDQFAQAGGKIGTTLRIRLPNDYTVRTGPTAAPQDTVEQNTTLTVATQKGVDISFSSVDRAMSLDDFGDRILAPMVNNLAGAVAGDIISGSENIPNLIHAVDGSNNTISPTFTTWATANGLLNSLGAPMGQRQVVVDPITEARTVSSFSGLFNSQDKVGRQYTTGRMGNNVLGFDWSMDQTVLQHTTGAYSTLGTVSGASQTGSAVTTSALAGPLTKGDVISFAGVFAVNRVTKASTGALAQFVVTANVAGGATSIPIYPALTPGNVAYGTVSASPANGAAITVATKAGEVYRKNFVFVPQAVTMVTADLELPRGVHEAARERYAGISMRMVSAYNISTDQFITRLDILYGHAWIRPEWAVVVADAL
jgi:hypothetical protein